MKSNNLIPWSKPKFFKSERENLLKALNSSWISGGKYIDKFENEISKKLKIRYVSCVSNGTSALHSAFLALGLKRNDEIIIPGFGYLAAANIAYQMGLKIKFVDVDLKNYCLSFEELKKSLTLLTKAVVFIHTYGNCGDIERISKLLKKKKIPLIEDAAEAFGSKYKKKYLGTHGDLGTFSFHATKNITTGEGGCVVTNKKKLFDNVNLYRSHGVKEKRYFHIVPGHNFRLTNLQASLGYSQIKNLNKIINKRKKIYKNYLKHINPKKNQIISLQKVNSLSDFVPWTLAVFIKDLSEKKRDNVIRQMYNNNIETRNGFYFPKRLMMFKKIKNLKNSVKLSNQIICLPIFFDLSETKIKNISKIFLKIIKK